MVENERRPQGVGPPFFVFRPDKLAGTWVLR
mgnify:CR=1 FL=1